MASKETQQLDNIIASRRAMLVGGGAVALAAAFLPAAAKAASTVTTYTDADILNFALNLEYLEANFYYLAAFGTTINAPNAAVTAAGGAMIPITGTGTQGTVVTNPAGSKVPFALENVAGYAVETAIEEGKHVLFLQKALGSAAVAQPQIDLYTSFNTLAMAAGIASTFNPFASDATFLVGAYIFEDVGVTAYSGAAPLITTSSNLQAAASILAVEAYHAGMIRTTINAVDPTNTLGYIGYTQKVSALRAALSKAVAPTSPAYPSGTYGDDVPLTTNTTYSLAGGSPVSATTIVDADQTNVIAFARNTTQVLNIVTGGGAATSGSKATGVFFPNGLNGIFS
ncbi:MAG TPA: ferritin-like domain-containing protein [Candidatus Aquilonibacter sp.]|nr:ferritin-like domain-containing protein [Candidatus Aquilonibacter sp.]